MNIVEILITPQVLTIAAAIVSILLTFGRIPTSRKRTLSQHWLWRKILPLLPVVMGGAAAFMPGAVGDTECQWGTKVLVGVWSGLIAVQGRKVFNRLVKDKLRGTGAE